jgi:hypothetical protein
MLKSKRKNIKIFFFIKHNKDNYSYYSINYIMKISISNNNNNNNNNNSYNHVLSNLQDYMFTSKNLNFYTKHIFKNENINCEKENYKKTQSRNINNKTINNIYQPKQKDSLFWCFYIIKYGYTKYEMEIGNQHFVIEKQEKFKYVDVLREKKDILKIHKIKPLSELEDNLTNGDLISIKTFLALCIVENINILLIDKRKYYELIVNDEPHINIIVRNRDTKEHYIELENLPDKIINYRNNYYKMTSFEDKLKAITSYKLEDLNEICKQLNININKNQDDKKKRTKKELYELIIANL